MTEQLRQDDIVTAAEYVLGTLRGPARDAFQQRLQADPALQREVHYWEQRLAQLNGGFDPVTPRAIVWAGIDRSINAAPVKMQPQRPLLWQAWAGLATAASLVLSVALYHQMNLPPPPAQIVRVEVPVKQPMPYVAMLKPTGSNAQWLVTMSPERGMIRVSGQGNYPIDRSRECLQLWLLDDDGKPHSLGELPMDSDKKMDMPMPSDMPMPKKPTLAVSMEPMGGSPTGKPTGPVIVASHAERAS